MQKFVNVRSTAETVEALEIGAFLVFKNVGITEVNEPVDETTGEGGFVGFEIEEQYVYEKDEYITLLAEENEELKSRTDEVESTLDGLLTDVIPSLV